MTKKDIKLWQVFINQNGYLSLAYQVSSLVIKVINYNGSIYQLVSNLSVVNYSDTEFSADEFFLNYPEQMFNYNGKQLFSDIKKEYLIWKKLNIEKEMETEFFTNNKLLLIL